MQDLINKTNNRQNILDFYCYNNKVEHDDPLHLY